MAIAIWHCVLISILFGASVAQQQPNPFLPFDQGLQATTTFNPLDNQPFLPGNNQQNNRLNPDQSVDRRSEEGWWHLYPFGYYDVDITRRPWNDRQIDLDFFLPFFGFRYNYTFIFPEGFVAFSYPYYIQPPYSFPNENWPREDDPSLIAPFMIDQGFMAVGQTRISHVWYRVVHRPPNMIGQGMDPETQGRQTQNRFPAQGRNDRQFPDRYYQGQLLRTQSGYIEDPEFLDQITRDIRHGMVGARGFTADYALVVTWERMSYGGAPKVTRLQLYDQVKRWQNTYQMVIATDEIRTYVMFNYANINWTSSTSAGALDGRGGKQSAIVGFNGGNGTGFFQLPYSAEGNSYKLVQFGSTQTAGRWMARVDEVMIYGGCSNKSTGAMFLHTPMIPMLGGFALNISGPCFRPTNIIKFQINELTIDCERIDMVVARCFIPQYQTFRIGWVGCAVSVDGGVSYPYFTDCYLMAPHLSRQNVHLVDDPVYSDNNWLNKDASALTLRWPAANITTRNANIDIVLYGYWEDTMYHELSEVGVLATSIQNAGEYTFQPKSLDRSRMLTDSWRKFTGGVIQVRVTDNWAEDRGDILYWSPLIPFGWYFQETWKYELGDNWAMDKCLEWFEWDGRRENFMMETEQQMPCPCTIDQAVQDMGRFFPMSNCDRDGSTFCPYHPGHPHCIVSTGHVWTGSGQVCCYGHEGYLTFSDDYEYNAEYLRYYVPGTPYRAHEWGAFPYKQPPYVPSLSNFYNDILSFEACCKWAGRCEFYYWRRQTSGCQNYIAPTLGFAYGEPHFITYDGLQYSFQGRGYYVLTSMKSPVHDLMVQIRMEQPPKTMWDSEVPATVITGLAAHDNGSAKVEVYARKTFRRWRYKTDVYVNGVRQFFDTPIRQMYVYQGVVIRKPARVMDMSEIDIAFATGVGIIIREANGFLSIQVSLPATYNRTARIIPPGTFVNSADGCSGYYQTLGLLGTFNGQRNDDLARPDCRSIQADYPQGASQLQTIFTEFGERWRADGVRHSILFNARHKALYNPLLFAEPNFRPVYNLEAMWQNQSRYESLVFSREQVTLECQGVSSCEFDYIMTGRKDYAMTTLKLEKQFQNMKSSSEKPLISCGNLAKNMGVKKFPPFGNYFDGDEIVFSCQPEYFLHGEARRTCMNGTWSPGWWAWCRPRGFEYFLKWLVGLATSLMIVLMFAAIFCMCFYRRRKQNDKYPSNNGGFGTAFRSPISASSVASGPGSVEKPNPQSLDNQLSNQAIASADVAFTEHNVQHNNLVNTPVSISTTLPYQGGIGLVSQRFSTAGNGLESSAPSSLHLNYEPRALQLGQYTATTQI